MNWTAFAKACPEIADVAKARFARDELALVGTIRQDGSPRISPNEVDFAADRLLLGMMWRSKKALDLLRDPRIVVHSVPSDRLNPDGDVKLYGLAVEESKPGVRKVFREAILARIDWAPEEPEYHLFSLNVRSAAYTRFGEEESFALAWDPTNGLRQVAAG
jgi:hypothetical protein